MNNGNNSRKLIGTIIGVLFFAILIVGATFAWLTIGANVSNGVYNTSTLNFVVNYTSGNDVTNLPVLLSDITRNEYLAAGGQVISGTAYKEMFNGKIYFKLHINNTADNDALVSAGCIRYTVYYGMNNAGQIGSLLTGPEATATGIITSQNVDVNRDVTLYNGALLEQEIIPPNGYHNPSYRIYFWIDNELVTNDQVGLTFSGYVHAYAVQLEPDR